MPQPPAPRRTLKLDLAKVSTGPVTSDSVSASNGKPGFPAIGTPRAPEGAPGATQGGNFQLPTVSTGAGQPQAGINPKDPAK